MAAAAAAAASRVPLFYSLPQIKNPNPNFSIPTPRKPLSRSFAPITTRTTARCSSRADDDDNGADGQDDSFPSPLHMGGVAENLLCNKAAAAALANELVLLAKHLASCSSLNCHVANPTPKVWDKGFVVVIVVVVCILLSARDDADYLLKLVAGSVGGGAVIKYGSILFPDITRPNILQALLMVSLPVLVAVLILFKESRTDSRSKDLF